jgi:hypothetical protein
MTILASELEDARELTIILKDGHQLETNKIDVSQFGMVKHGIADCFKSLMKRSDPSQ